MIESISHTYRDGYEPLSARDIDALEERTDWRLPSDYREFLLEQNGGTITDELAIRLPNPTPNSSWCNVDLFYLLAPGVPDNIESESASLPDGFVAVAESDKDKICIDARRSSDGAVYFWDRAQFWESEEEETEEEPEVLFWAANSLKEFLGSCQINYDRASLRTSYLFCKANIDNDISMLLQENGGDINRPLESDLTLLMHACDFARPRVVRLLLEAGADPTFRTATGRSALHSAAGTSPDCVRMLLDSDVDINSQDSQGTTPLMEAAKFTKFYAAELLLRGGADKSLRNKDGKRAVDLCKNLWLKKLLK